MTLVTTSSVRRQSDSIYNLMTEEEYELWRDERGDYEERCNYNLLVHRALQQTVVDMNLYCAVSRAQRALKEAMAISDEHQTTFSFDVAAGLGSGSGFTLEETYIPPSLAQKSDYLGEYYGWTNSSRPGCY